MNNSDIINLLADNIRSSVTMEKPLGSWFINILLPLLIGNTLLVVILIVGYSPKLLTLFFITVFLCCLCFCRTMLIRALRVDKYISRKQQFFQIIKDYYIENNKDVNNEQFLILLNNIDVLCLVKKRLTPILISLFLIALISIKIIFMSLEYFLATGLIILIIFTYYMYLANSIWQTIFNMEKNIYHSLYGYLCDYDRQFKVLDIPVKHMNFTLNVILSILTLGIYPFYWDYLFHTAPDKTFPYVHDIEKDIFNRITAVNHIS